MASEDEDRPRRKVAQEIGHEIGQELALLSVEELRDRIALLQSEIARLEAAMKSKEATRSAADKFFRS